MQITSALFDAYLKCPTKCFLRSKGEQGVGNAYAEWVRTRDESYRNDGIRRLLEGLAPEECVIRPSSTGNRKAAKWRLAVDFVAQAQNCESSIDMLERIPPERRGGSAQFIPIRFVFNNKLTLDDRLLIGFDACLLSELLGHKVDLGKIIHGDGHSTHKVKTARLTNLAGKLTKRIADLLSGNSPPVLMLNHHCAECEFQAGCRRQAVEKDDLSLLAGMNERELKKYASKGIFTITQLSHTFRPRRRPKRLRDKRERYHHALKARAIREGKIHVIGTPELKIDGTPVYLDVEGLPDRDFYYLIGIRVPAAEKVVQHSFWADGKEDERKIWADFLAILAEQANPVLIHYGSFETTFLKRMVHRYGNAPEGSPAAKALVAPINVLSAIFAQVYFPTYSNTLKDVASWLGLAWSDPALSGPNSVACRAAWEHSPDAATKQRLITYNREDCEALERTTNALLRLAHLESSSEMTDTLPSDVVKADSLPAQYTMWPKFSSPISDFEQINKAARWNYQQDRVYVRTRRRKKTRNRKQALFPAGSKRINMIVPHSSSTICPYCHRPGSAAYRTARVLYDVRFGRWSLKRWVVKYEFISYHCRECRQMFGAPEAFWPGSKYGRNLVMYLVYQLIELCMPQRTVMQSVNRLFGFNLADHTVHILKARAAGVYTHTRQAILKRMLAGPLIHADETQIRLKGQKAAYVWVLTSLKEVVYLHSETREGDMVQEVLSGFKGVLVSDFYAPYDNLDCAKQKCLLHLMRDLNDKLLDHPYDLELRGLVQSFAELLRPMIEAVDRYGLKKYFLAKHETRVDRFFRQIARAAFTSEPALKCRQRFEKHRGTLFTFLHHDGIPWNNNNAEHAIKAFARLRRVIDGLSTVKGIDQYLVLLSVCQTCRYQGLDFLDFLLSGEKDIDAYAQSRRSRRTSVSAHRGDDLAECVGSDCYKGYLVPSGG
jgi:predicted RecB family nuclease